MASIGKESLEQMGDGAYQIYTRLLRRFIRLDKGSDIQDDDRSESDTLEYLNSLAKSIGYTIIVKNSLEKTFKHEKRLKAIEDRIKNSQLPTNMRMFEEPQLEKYR